MFTTLTLCLEIGKKEGRVRRGWEKKKEKVRDT